MIEYWDIDEYVKKKADLYNYINPFFNLNYLKSHNFFYTYISLTLYRAYFDNLYCGVDSNIRLDVNQRIAILSSPKHELVIAGAGSGKTTTIAAKIKFMVEIKKINPKSMLLLSYTNEAVNEMKNVIVNKFGINTDIMTFHKFAILLLNSYKNIGDYIDYNSIKYSFYEKIILYFYLYAFYNIKILDIVSKNELFTKTFNIFEQDCNKYFYEKLKLKQTIKSLLFKYNAINYYNKIDPNDLTFDSLIYNACQLEEYNRHYEFVLIDEYQDISNLRFTFIKKYLTKESSKIMCVGDDWQTIFSFASSNINNIMRFEQEFNDSLVLKIINTYRNSQELIDIAGNFIMKNENQIKKRLRSTKSITNPIEFIDYKNKCDLINKIASKIEQIIDKKIAFISRYNFDVQLILDGNVFKMVNGRLIYKNKKEIYFYTIHTSKGLGFDYVFVLNHNKGYYGFPPKRKNITVFEEESSIYEERRLYYVALTRTKNKVYLVYPSKKYSVFLKEIKNMLKKNKNLL